MDHPGSRNFIPTQNMDHPGVGIKFLPWVPITKNHKNKHYWYTILTQISSELYIIVLYGIPSKSKLRGMCKLEAHI